jgi:hypothetical protein
MDTSTSFHDHQIETRLAHGGDGVTQVLGHLVARYPGGEGAHVDVGMIDGVHADAVAQQCAAGLSP